MAHNVKFSVISLLKKEFLSITILKVLKWERKSENSFKIRPFRTTAGKAGS